MRRRRLLSLVIAVLVAGVVPHAQASTRGVTAGPPLNYRAIRGLSQAVYKQKIRTVHRVISFDGLELYVEVVRPKARGRYPVIAELSPYHGTVYKRDGIRPLPFDGGLVNYFVPRGYAVLMMDLRGTGRSQGCLDLIGPKDRADIKRVIEWAARQPWSNGRVGTVGHSYPGATGVAALSQRPKGLVTAVVSAALGSMYDHQFQAGVPYNALWLGPIYAYFEMSVQRHLPPGLNNPAIDGDTGDNFGNDMQYFGCGAQSSSAFAGDAELTGEYADWHRQRDFRAGASTSPVPVFVTHGVNDDAARVIGLNWFMPRNGSLRANGKPVVDKLWIGQWTHGVGCCPNRRGRQWTAALHAWLDKHLQRRDVSTGPPVELFLADGTQEEAVPAGRDEIFTARRFPGSPRMAALHTSVGGRLQSRADEPGSLEFAGDPFGAGSERFTGAAEFRTGPLREDMLLAGMPELTIAASFTTPMVHLIANLYEETDDGQWRRLTHFAINSALRDSLDNLSPALPGQRYVLRPPGWPMAHHARKGNRLVLRITTSDPDKFPFFAIDPRVVIFTGQRGTTLRVPVVDNPVLYEDRLPLN